MIVYRGDIDPGLFSDCADGGALESLLGEDFARCAENFIARLFLADFSDISEVDLERCRMGGARAAKVALERV